MHRPSPETLEAFYSQSLRPKYGFIALLWLITPRLHAHLPLPASIASSVPATPSPFALPHVAVGGTAVLAAAPVGESPLTPPYQRAAAVESARDHDGAPTSAMHARGSTSQDVNSSNSYTPPPLSPPPPHRSACPFTLAVAVEGSGLRNALLDDSGSVQAAGLVEEEDETPATENVEMERGIEERERSTEPKSGDATAESLATRSHSAPSHLAPDACPIDYRGRPLCPDSVRVPLSLRKRSSELADATSEFGKWVLASLHALALSLLKVRLSPWMLYVLVLHVLLGVQLASLVLEDAIVRVGLSDPLPPDFPRANSLAKRVTRFKWRLKAAWRRYWTHAAAVGVLGLVVVGVALECLRTEATTGWNDVPFGRWLLPTQGPIDSDTKRELVGGGPFRDLLLLESISTLLFLLQPLKHLLPISILPSTISPPTFLFSTAADPVPTPFFSPTTAHGPCPPTPRISLDTLWLISLLVDGFTSLLTLFACATLVPLLPSYSPLSFPPHIIFHLARARLGHITTLRTGMLRTVECLRTVFAAFPEPTADDDGWVCTICFGAQGDDESEAGKTAQARCCLPCGHKYHAGCLVHWFHFQSWCPVCHATPVHAAHPAPSATLPVFVNSDEYPGNVRRRRQGALEVELD